MDGNLEKTLFTLYGTEWRERGYGLGGIISYVTGPAPISTVGTEC
jgi:hypothetical protein